jgi:hypothetical protein
VGDSSGEIGLCPGVASIGAVQRVALLMVLGLALSLGGCGFGGDDDRTGGAVVRVTRDFGHVRLGSAAVARVEDGQTPTTLLRSRFKDVPSIEGLRRRPGADWFLFVNGVEHGDAHQELAPGDRLQWDYRSTAAGGDVPAIVGAFPEPLLHGTGGKRRPVRLECDTAAAAACKAVDERLRAVGVFATRSTLGAPGTQSVIRVVVGLWPRVAVTAAMLEDAPRESGVFARFASGGLQLLDEDGRAVRTVRPGDGTGLVAAVRPREDELVWIVTALDHEGLTAAADSLTGSRLRDAYAVAATGPATEKLPLAGR